MAHAGAGQRLQEPPAPELAAGGAPPDTLPAPQEEEREELEELYALSHEDRAVIHLHYYQGYSTGEIAQLLGQRPGTIRARLFRARGRLKRLLKGEFL